MVVIVLAIVLAAVVVDVSVAVPMTVERVGVFRCSRIEHSETPLAARAALFGIAIASGRRQKRKLLLGGCSLSNAP